ncbi:MAG: hypothetical protein V4631_21140 [Pseudomonadota bacterium]
MEPIVTTGIRQWQSHKKVRAEKITAIEIGAQTVRLQFAAGHAEVSHQWNVKHHPHAGGYFVVYEDGYSSFSPAPAFEAGYTEIAP